MNIIVLYAYVLCLCILASSRIPRYDLGRQTPGFQGGSVTIVNEKMEQRLRGNEEYNLKVQEYYSQREEQ
jgi:hypothetical protein